LCVGEVRFVAARVAVTQLSSCRHSSASSSLSPAHQNPEISGGQSIAKWSIGIEIQSTRAHLRSRMALILHDPPWNHLAGVCRCRDLADLPPWNTQLCARSPSLPTQLTLARFCLATGRRFVPAHRFHLSSYIFSRTLPWSQNDAQRC